MVDNKTETCADQFHARISGQLVDCRSEWFPNFYLLISLTGGRILAVLVDRYTLSKSVTWSANVRPITVRPFVCPFITFVSCNETTTATRVLLAPLESVFLQLRGGIKLPSSDAASNNKVEEKPPSPKIVFRRKNLQSKGHCCSWPENLSWADTSVGHEHELSDENKFSPILEPSKGRFTFLKLA